MLPFETVWNLQTIYYLNYTFFCKTQRIDIYGFLRKTFAKKCLHFISSDIFMQGHLFFLRRVIFYLWEWPKLWQSFNNLIPILVVYPGITCYCIQYFNISLISSIIIFILRSHVYTKNLFPFYSNNNDNFCCKTVAKEEFRDDKCYLASHWFYYSIVLQIEQ